MRGITIGVAEQSHHLDFQAEDIVLGILGWQDYAVTNGDGLTRLPKDPSLPLTAHLGLFGIIGPTAYFGAIFDMISFFPELRELQMRRLYLYLLVR
jgi:NADPH-dependent curcumin reductase CurA